MSAVLKDHKVDDLIAIFNTCFKDSHNTVLLRGTDEPIYLPANKDNPYHAIYFAHGYFSSALHECAHWLIAGEARRQEIDYGYWYAPDGRNAEQQMLFQQVEAKPQALEWILSKAADHPFRLSFDNLNGGPIDETIFANRVLDEVKSYCEQGLNYRALRFRLALCDFYQTNPNLITEHFTSLR